MRCLLGACLLTACLPLRAAPTELKTLETKYDSIKVGQDEATRQTIIRADEENFIFSDGTHLFFEKRILGKGLPIRRDERGE